MQTTAMAMTAASLPRNSAVAAKAIIATAAGDKVTSVQVESPSDHRRAGS
jgi:hypothetical protein